MDEEELAMKTLPISNDGQSNEHRRHMGLYLISFFASR
jgi:hypothetical protein